MATITAQDVLETLRSRKLVGERATVEHIHDPRKARDAMGYCYLEDGFESGGVTYPVVRQPKRGTASGAFCRAITEVIDELRAAASGEGR